MLEEFENKKILILGFSREGRDSFRFLRRLFPNKVLGIADKNPKIRDQKIKRVKWYLGKSYLSALKKYEVIIKTPGIPFKILPKSALSKITTQTEIFFENCPGKIIGVTGTKGKSTTATLIYKVLKSRGLPIHLIGNIGKPALSFLEKAKKNDLFVYELSSHQLSQLKKSPQIAVFLNIYPEHLDYYQNFNEYLQAKTNILNYQTKKDYLIFNPKDKLVREIAKKSKAKKIPIKGLEKYFKILKKVGIKNKALLGEHNLLNIAAAIEVGELFNVSEKEMIEVIKNFKGLPHRLEYVGKFKGIDFYNDSLATIPESTIFALNSLGERVETIFLGGFDRGLNFRNLAKRILKSQIKNLIFFPTTGEKIWLEIKKRLKNKRKKFNVFFIEDIKEGVKLAFKYTKKGKICLLSCASASFGLFKDYKERGDLFKKYVRYYGKKKGI